MREVLQKFYKGWIDMDIKKSKDGTTISGIPKDLTIRDWRIDRRTDNDSAMIIFFCTHDGKKQKIK